jgi:UDP-N-acetylglucosamine diphosphorylase/glucosamine-1-phosphate N-acetyltransferase
MPARPEHICLFEDQGATSFSPLVYFRPVYNLRCGILSLKEKILARYPRTPITLHCREFLAGYMRHRNPGTLVNEIPSERCLCINGRVVADDLLPRQIANRTADDVVFMRGDSVVAAWLSGPRLRRLQRALNRPLTSDDFAGIRREEVGVDLVSYPWDIVKRNGRQIVADYRMLTGARRSPVSAATLRRQGVQIVGASDLHVQGGASIKPGTVLDAEDGPIFLGHDVRVFPQATIMGPAAIGDRTWVKVNAQIYPNTTVGPVCKVGGEVEGSIIHGYANKQHHGFLGHSYIGAWANLGAGTTNSDLKSNYGLVRVSTATGSIETGEQFVGLILGDHSKTAINSMFNTGTVVGVCSNIFGFGFPPKYVPSFSWGAAGETLTTFSIDRAVEMARRVMGRRSIELLEVEDRLFHTIFDETADERRQRGMPN